MAVPRLNGLAKHHKTDTPLRPVLSSFNSIYPKIKGKMTKCLSVVQETQINLKTSDVVNTIKEMRLNPEEKLVSFDIKSLYTNVTAQEALKVAANLLYNNDEYINQRTKVSQKVFIKDQTEGVTWGWVTDRFSKIRSESLIETPKTLLLAFLRYPNFRS